MQPRCPTRLPWSRGPKPGTSRRTGSLRPCRPARLPRSRRPRQPAKYAAALPYSVGAVKKAAARCVPKDEKLATMSPRSAAEVEKTKVARRVCSLAALLGCHGQTHRARGVPKDEELATLSSSSAAEVEKTKTDRRVCSLAALLGPTDQGGLASPLRPTSRSAVSSVAGTVMPVRAGSARPRRCYHT